MVLHSHRRYAAVVIDHKAARFFELAYGEFSLADTKKFVIDTSKWKRKDQGSLAAERTQKTRGPLRDLYERRVDAHYRRLCHEVALQAAQFAAKQRLDGLFLVGPERLTLSVFEKIPRDLAQRTVRVGENFGGLSPSQVQLRMQPLLAEYDQQRRVAAVELLQSSSGGALTNPDEVLNQLQQGRVRSLIVVRDLNLVLRDCPTCKIADTAAGSVCARCGARRKEIALGEVIARVWSQHAVNFEFVGGQAADLLRKTGGLGGWLNANKRRPFRMVVGLQLEALSNDGRCFSPAVSLQNLQPLA